MMQYIIMVIYVLTVFHTRGPHCRVLIPHLGCCTQFLTQPQPGQVCLALQVKTNSYVFLINWQTSVRGIIQPLTCHVLLIT